MTMKKAKNIHEGHRARMKRKFLRQKENSFAEHELLELLLFYAIPRRETNTIAHALIERFGSLRGVLSASPEELVEIKGVQEHSAGLIRLVRELSAVYAETAREKNFKLDTLDKIGKLLLEKYVGCTNEKVMCVLLDNSLGLIACEILHEGSINSAAFQPRKLFELAYSRRASSVVLAHNHPGGIAIPSGDDLTTTSNIAAGLDLLGINLLEHIIIADGHYAPIIRNSRNFQSSAVNDVAKFYSKFYETEKI